MFQDHLRIGVGMHSYKHYKDKAVGLFEKFGWTGIFVWYSF